MVPAVLDAVLPAIAAGPELAVLAGPIELADVDVVLSAAQPVVGPVSAATVQHAAVIDQHSLVQLDSPLTLQRLSLPFWWREVTRGSAYCLPHDPPWTGSMHVPSIGVQVIITVFINTSHIVDTGIVIASICIRVTASSAGGT